MISFNLPKIVHFKVGNLSESLIKTWSDNSYQILIRKLFSMGASLVTCGIIFLLPFLPIVSLVGILGIIFGPLVVTGFLTLMDIYHASYQNLVEPSKT
jgi:Cu/Ag efflux pump CusA